MSVMDRQVVETIVISPPEGLETALRRPRLFGAALRPTGMLSVAGG